MRVDLLETELAAWAAVGRKPSIWLRDDDAIEATPALDRLRALSDGHGAPAAIAVIPEGATPGLARALAAWKSVSVLQHGYAHANHAVGNAKKSEFGDGRSLETMTGELLRGRETIDRLFGDAAEPVLAPPWNRIAETLLDRLPGLGIQGLSRFKPRQTPEPAPGLYEANTHVDLIDWRGGRVGKSSAAVADELAAHLQARRQGGASADEPTGILAHHLVMDDVAWRALDRLLGRLGGDDRVSWPVAADIFSAEAAA